MYIVYFVFTNRSIDYYNIATDFFFFIIIIHRHNTRIKVVNNLIVEMDFSKNEYI